MKTEDAKPEIQNVTKIDVSSVSRPAVMATVHEEKNKAFDRMHGTLEARQKQIRDFKRRSYDS